MNVLIANLDGDPNEEIIAPVRGGAPQPAWNFDGTEVTGWPVTGRPGVKGRFAAGQLNLALPGMEVAGVYGSSQITDAQLFVYSGAGVVLAGFPITIPSSVRSGVVIADMNGDGLDEILIGADDGKIYAYRADGTSVPGWPVQTNTVYAGTPVVVDLDNNGDVEIIATSRENTTGPLGYVNAYHHGGTPVSGFGTTSFRYDTSGSSLYPVAGDVDGDGQIEIVMAGYALVSGTYRLAMYVYSATGGFERQMLQPDVHAQSTSAPALADLDGDNFPEILAQSYHGMSAWYGNGTFFPGWPLSSGDWHINMTPVVGDVTGDNIPEVVAMTQRGGSCDGGELYIFDRNGHLLNDDYKFLKSGAGGVPAIADIDRDGRNEVVVMGDVYCGQWGLSTPRLWAYEIGDGTHGLIQWGQFGNGPRHNGVYIPRSTFVDLELSMSDSPDPVIAGGTIRYDVVVENLGSGMAKNVHLDDTLPTDVALVSATPSQGSCISTATSVTCQLGNIMNGGSATISIVVRRNVEGEITNTASVVADQTETDLTNNSASEITTVVPGADLIVTQSADQVRYTSGDTVHMTVNVQNAGPYATSGVTLSHLVPPGLSVVSRTPNQGTFDTAFNTWTIGELASGASATLEIEANILPVTFSNTFFVQANILESDVSDPNLNNNAHSLPIPVDVIDLRVDLSVNKTVPALNDPLVFALKLTNAGNRQATGIEIKMTLPAGLSFVSSQPSQGTYSSASGIWLPGNLGAGASATMTINASIASGADGQTLIAQAAVQASAQFDSDSTNDTDSVMLLINGVDLYVISIAAPALVSEGETVTYTIQARSSGPNPANHVRVTALLPSDVDYVSSMPGQGTYDNLTGIWDVGSLASNGAATLTLTATAKPDSGGKTVVNTVQITDLNQPDPDPSDNSTTSQFVVRGADLRLTNTPSRLIVGAGSTVIYTIVVTNDGPTSTTGVVVNDLLPAELIYQSHTVTRGTYDPLTGVWTVGSLNYPSSPRSATLTITTTVGSSFGTTILNTAQVTANDLPDPDSADNTAVATIYPNSTDLRVTKTRSGGNPGEGNIVNYTVTLTEVQGIPPSGVRVEDILPPELTFVSYTASIGTYDNVTGIWDVGSPTTLETLSISAQVKSGVVGTVVTNTARILPFDQIDPAPSNNVSSTAFTAGITNLSVNQTIDDNALDPGESSVVRVQVTNPAAFPARNVEVTDLLPFGLNFASATASHGTYDPNTGIWTIGTINGASSATLDITVVADQGAHGQWVYNVATITHADNPDSSTSNNSYSLGVFITSVELTATVSASAGHVYFEGAFSYTISVTNYGDQTATGVTAVALLPDQVTLTSTSGGCSLDNLTVTCGLGALARYETAAVTLNVQAKSGFTGLLNFSTSISAVQPELDMEDNAGSISVGVTKLIVNSSDDSNDGACSQSHCALREAMIAANAIPGLNTIRFDIPGTGVKTILLASALPQQTGAVNLDATTQPGYSGAPLIELSGELMQTGDADGLWLSGGDSTVRGFIINHFRGHGIQAEGGANYRIVGNYFGTDHTGTTAKSWIMGSAIFLSASDSVIGGTTPAERNIITGARGMAVTMAGSGNVIQGNYVGINVNGNAILGNGGGISVSGDHALIGGTSAVERNVIAASGTNNGQLVLAASDSVVQGNYIGTDVTGTLDFSSEGMGIVVTGVRNLIGGTEPGAGNLISGNGRYAIYLYNLYASTPLYNTIQGNKIGVDVTGTQPLGNFVGIYIESSNNIIGGTEPGEGNIISNSSNRGLRVEGDYNIIQGNYVGTDVTGTLPLGNNIGIEIRGRYNQIGGTTPAARNLIADSTSFGVYFSNGYSVGNQIQGNYIGTDVTGMQPLGNGNAGIRISLANHSSNLIGGTEPGAGNRIAFNGDAGIYARASYSDWLTAGILGNEIFDNAALGIDLSLTDVGSVNPNDSGDTDIGANYLQNYPVLTSAILQDSLEISGTLDSTPNQSYRLEFFSNRVCDPSGYGEGEKFMGAASVALDASGQAAFTVNLGNSVPIGQYITATASDPNNNTSEFSACVVLDGTDLALNADVSSTAPNIADTVTFALEVTNQGPEDASGVTVEISIPAGTTYQLHSGDGSYVAGVWDIGTLAVDQTAALEITLTVDGGTAGQTLLLSAEIATLNEGELNLSNNSATLNLQVATADLNMVLDASDDAPNEGNSIEYIAVVRNNGPGRATNVNVSLPLPSGVTFASELLTQGSYDETSALWTVGALAKNTQASLTITVTVDPGTAGTTINASAEISTSEQTDPNGTDNEDNASILIGMADIGIASTVNDSNPKVGDEIQLTIVMTNNGPSEATDVIIENALPEGITFTQAEMTFGSFNSANKRWTLSNLTAQHQAVLTIRGTINSGTYGTTLVNNASILDRTQIDENAANDLTSVEMSVQEYTPPLVQTPILIEPSQGGSTDNRQPIFSWTSVSGAAKYQMQLGISNPPVYLIDDIIDVTYTPTWELSTTVNYWRVRAVSASGDVSEWSAIRSLLIESPAGDAPELNYYADSTPEIAWQRVSWATAYRVQVATSKSFVMPYAFEAELSLETLSVQTDILPNGSYFWRVQAKRADGSWGMWSTTISFTISRP